MDALCVKCICVDALFSLMPMHVFAVESLIDLGYAREQIERSLEMERYDEIWAAYHLLDLPIYAVSFCDAASIIFVMDYILYIIYFYNDNNYPFSALTLLVGRDPACKNPASAIPERCSLEEFGDQV